MGLMRGGAKGLKWVFISLLTTLVCYAPLHAAEVTDVIDAADGDDPFDLRAEVEFRRSLRRAKITREFQCGYAEFANNSTGLDPCPGGPQYGSLLHVKELRFERVVQELVPTLRFGLWHDLELLIEAPIVLANEQTVRFAGNGGD
ncbi:MAG: hypothetical protein VX589_20415, partial [Myxococcota bacterium]|nr:hypothetical protein [Myxococcota bacterium]